MAAINLDHAVAGTGRSTGLKSLTATALAADGKKTEVAPTGADTSLAVEKTVSAVDKTEVEQAIAKFNDLDALAAKSVSFSLDEETDRTVVKITDKTTGEVLRQIPTEDVLSLLANMDDMRGLLFAKEA